MDKNIIEGIKNISSESQKLYAKLSPLIEPKNEADKITGLQLFYLNIQRSLFLCEDLLTGLEDTSNNLKGKSDKEIQDYFLTYNKNY